MGKHRSNVWGVELSDKKNKHEIHHGLRQPSINYGSHNNQPKTGSRVGGKYGGEVRQAGRVGVAQYHHSGGVVS